MTTKTRKPNQTTNANPYVVGGVTFESRAKYIAIRRRYRRTLRAEMETAKRGARS